MSTPPSSLDVSSLPARDRPRVPDSEPIPGYRLIEPLGQGGFGEVWKCEAPGGLFKAIKFVQGGGPFQDDRTFVEQEFQALQCIKAIRHPFLLSMERVELRDGELLIVMELADKSLQDVLEEYRAAGQPGIPRDELLDYLLEAAEALDLINDQHGLQHLDVKGRNLFLVSNHVKVADFGLVSSLQEKRVAPDATTSQYCRLGGLTPLYSAPEAMQRKISRFCDQYSLAVVYQELLTGTLPFTGKNARQLVLRHLTEPPDLAALPEEDRPIVAQALAKKPEQRFTSCLEFAQTLLLGAEGMRQFKHEEGANRRRPSAAFHRTAVLRKTPLAQSPATPNAQTQPPPGDTVTGGELQYIQCLNQEPHRELWRVRTPAGRDRLAYLLRGFSVADRDELARVLALLRAIAHDAVMPFEVAQNDVHRVVLLTDAYEATLGDRFLRYQNAHKPGIPREELLDTLGRAAQALDALVAQYALCHLGLNPGNVLLGRRGEVRLAEFGWLQQLWLSGARPLAEFNPRYAAPELAENKPGPACDQYSLGVMFAELLTGYHPARFGGVRRGSSQRGRPGPDLSLLPANDRDVLERALHRDPHRRFGRCAELIDALRGTARPVPVSAAPARPERTPTVPAEPARVIPARTAPALYVPQPTWQEVVSHLVQATSSDLVLQEHNTFRYVLGTNDTLEHRCGARLLPGIAELKLDGFRQRWDAQLKRTAADSYRLFVASQRSIWQACLGKRVGLEIEIDLRAPQRGVGGHTQVSVRMRPVGYSGEQGERLLHELGPELLESLRGFLLATPEQRSQQRWLCQQAMQIRHRLNSQEQAPIACTARDISRQGIGLVTPFEPRADKFFLSVPDPAGAEVVVPARIMRARACGDGWFEVGAVFLDDPRGLVR
jgi:serine/threonine protein kinase